MSSDNAAIIPATPRRIMTPMKALSGLFRSPTRLRTPTTLGVVSRHRNKRTRDDQTSPLNSPSSYRSTASSNPCTNPSLPAVVLQTYSVSTGSVVVTSLPSVPFCCHEDLLTMSRAQLEGVVRALNARLPRRMWIGPDTEDNFWGNDIQNERTEECDSDKEDRLSRMSEAEMRQRIEELVGIRAIVGKNRISRSGLGLNARTGVVPPAPKAVRTWNAAWRPYDKAPWEEMEVGAVDDQTRDLNFVTQDAVMGSSPLANRTKSGAYGRKGNNTSPLTILQEESEGSESKDDDPNDDEGRPSKRRRVSSGSLAQDSGEESKPTQEGRQSRFIEDIDVSGSPLLTREDDIGSNNLGESEEMVVARTGDHGKHAKASQGVVEGAPQRRRSARIKEIALKRALSVAKRKKISSDAQNPEQSILRSKTFSSRHTSITDFPSAGGNDVENPSVPREFSIRLPFTATPPRQKPDLTAWSALRILRSHSQRLSNSSQPTGARSSLDRSQSDRYPRAGDLAFVTINRPRYRFATRKSKGGEACNPSMSVSPTHATLQQGIQIDTEYSDEKASQDPKAITRNSGADLLHTGSLSSTLYGFLTPRSRAPSTSTVASTRGQGYGSDSPARSTLKEGTGSSVTNTVVSDGAAGCVSEALERMVVDSF